MKAVWRKSRLVIFAKCLIAYVKPLPSEISTLDGESAEVLATIRGLP